jgi:hypothetical protein
MAVFWVVAPCSLVEAYQRSRALMMEAANTSETLVNVYQTTQRFNPQDSQLPSRRRENLKSYYTCPVLDDVSVLITEPDLNWLVFFIYLLPVFILTTLSVAQIK